jgi:hypothetical protein
MARLTVEQWGCLKSDWVTGRYNNRELGERFGTSHTAIQKKANAEEWEKLDSSVVSDYIAAKVAISEEVSKVSKVSKVDSGNLSKSLDLLAEFEAKSNATLQRIDAKNLEMIDECDRPSDIKAVMETHIKHREARLGKQPDTAIQINNNLGNVDDLLERLT